MLTSFGRNVFGRNVSTAVCLHHNKDARFVEFCFFVAVPQAGDMMTHGKMMHGPLQQTLLAPWVHGLKTMILISTILLAKFWFHLPGIEFDIYGGVSGRSVFLIGLYCTR